MRIRSLLVLAVLLAPSGWAQVVFESSNLPIVLIDTDGVEIPDEPKIPATLAIVDNGPGARNAVTDPPSGYHGPIGIELRGSASLLFDKKQFGLETRDADGENNDVELLGMPEENDWVLGGPYVDKSLMRNALAYRIARSMGRYAPRTRFVEVVLNGSYHGVYVLTEKIKRDDNRVDINKLKPDETEGDDLTGGYLFRSDRTDDHEGWDSGFASADPEAGPVRYGFRDPRWDEIVPEQAAYIESWMDAFERVVLQDGMPEIEDTIDVGSFVDFVLVNELARNPDAYRLSTYFHKDKDSNDPRLHAGPVWDFDVAFGGATHRWGTGVENLMIDFPDFDADPYPRPVWWPVLVNSPDIQTALRARWHDLRQNELSDEVLEGHVQALAAELSEAQERNFRRWPVLGVSLWPNAFVGETHAEEVAYLRTWLVGRAAWLDDRFPVARGEFAPDVPSQLRAPSPNPASDHSVVSLTMTSAQVVRVDVYDVVGRRVVKLYNGAVRAAERRRFVVPTAGLAPGVYLIRAAGETFVSTQRLTVLR